MSILLKAEETTLFLQDEAHGVRVLFQKYRDLCYFQLSSARLLLEKIELLQKGMPEKMKVQLKQLFAGIHLNETKSLGCSKLQKYLALTWSLRGEFGLDVDGSLYLEHLINCRQGGDKKILTRIDKLIDKFSFQLKDSKRKQFLVHQQEEFLKKSYPNFYEALKGNLKKKEIILALRENPAEPSNSELIEMITELQAIILPTEEFSNLIAKIKEAFQASHKELLERFIKEFKVEMKLTVRPVQSPLAYPWPKPIVEVQVNQLISEYHINNQRWLPYDKLEAEGLKERFYYLEYKKMIMLIVWKRLGIQAYFVNRKQKYNQFIQQKIMRFPIELTQNIQVSRFFKFTDDSGLSLLYYIAKYARKSATSQMITDQDFSQFISSKLAQRRMEYIGALKRFSQLIEKQNELVQTSNLGFSQEQEGFLERVYSLEFFKLLEEKSIFSNQEDLGSLIEIVGEGKKPEMKAPFTMIKRNQQLLQLVISKNDRDLVYTTERNVEAISKMGLLKKQKITIEVAQFMIKFAIHKEWKIRMIEKLLSGNLTAIYEYLDGLHHILYKPIIE